MSTSVGTRKLTAQVHALDAVYVRPLADVVAVADPAALARFVTLLQIYQYYDGIFWLLDQPEVASLFDAATLADLIEAYERAAPRPRYLERTGALQHLMRRVRRGTSYVFENALGVDGLDPPRTAWTHTYWPDS